MINFFTILESFPMNEISERQATGRKGIGVNYLIAKTWKSFFLEKVTTTGGRRRT